MRLSDSSVASKYWMASKYYSPCCPFAIAKLSNLQLLSQCLHQTFWDAYKQFNSFSIIHATFAIKPICNANQAAFLAPLSTKCRLTALSGIRTVRLMHFNSPIVGSGLISKCLISWKKKGKRVTQVTLLLDLAERGHGDLFAWIKQFNFSYVTNLLLAAMAILINSVFRSNTANYLYY